MQRGAVHELGHAIVAERFIRGSVRSILVRRDGTGHVTFRSWLPPPVEAVMLAAGATAEYLLLGSSLLSKASDDVRQMQDVIGPSWITSRLREMELGDISLPHVFPVPPYHASYLAVRAAAYILQHNMLVLERYRQMIPRPRGRYSLAAGKKLKYVLDFAKL